MKLDFCHDDESEDFERSEKVETFPNCMKNSNFDVIIPYQPPILIISTI